MLGRKEGVLYAWTVTSRDEQRGEFVARAQNVVQVLGADAIQRRMDVNSLETSGSLLC